MTYIMHPPRNPRRSPPMRVTPQLVLCSDDGQEETITDSVTLQKDGMN